MKRKLALNVIKFRKQKGLSQAEIAEIAQLPRTTWTNIESGSANPSLDTLMKVAKVLHVSLDELVSEPIKGAHHLYRSHEMETIIKSSGLVEVFKLLPQAIAGVQLERFEMNAKALMKGSPHQKGSIEYLVCIQGQISIYLSGTPFHLNKGDVFVFDGDQAHSYKNNGRGKNSAISAIAFSEEK